MNPLFLSIFQFVIVFALAPLSVGLIRKAKATLQNRRGASIFQPYWALASLFRKEMTITKHSSWLFRAVPFFVLGSACVLLALVPALVPGNGQNSIFLMIATLAFGSFFLVLGGMDVASAFGGMGSSREMTLAALVEPVALLVFVTFGIVAKSWNLDGILTTMSQSSWYVASPLLFVTFIAFVMMILAENARYPVDNPATHLELTMVHEAMILEYSGPYLAMLEMASAIKLTVLSLLFMNLLFPVGLVAVGAGLGAFAFALVVLLVKLIIAAFLVGFIESTIVKMRFYRMQEYMAMAATFALLGFVLVVSFSR